QGAEFFKEQRQVIFDAGRDYAATQILIDRAAAVINFEPLTKASAKSGQRALVQRKFTCRQQVDLLDLVDRTLGFRVKGSQGFDFLIEQVDAERQATTHGKQIQQCAAHRVIAMLIDG